MKAVTWCQVEKQVVQPILTIALSLFFVFSLSLSLKLTSTTSTYNCYSLCIPLYLTRSLPLIISWHTFFQCSFVFPFLALALCLSLGLRDYGLGSRRLCKSSLLHRNFLRDNLAVWSENCRSSTVGIKRKISTQNLSI